MHRIKTILYELELEITTLQLKLHTTYYTTAAIYETSDLYSTDIYMYYRLTFSKETSRI